jgi:hypothetical protein
MDHVLSIGTMASSHTLREFADQSFRRSAPGETALLDDSVEISELAGFLNRLAELPETRARKIVAVRNQIQGGTYETPEKLDIATERLLARL